MARKSSLIALAILMFWPLALYNPLPAAANGGGGGAAAISTYSHKWAVVPYGSAPVIDGALSPGEWASFPLNGFSTVFEQKPSSSDSSFAVSYDDNNLYIGGSFDKNVKAITEKIEIVIAKGSNGEAHYVLPVPITPVSPATVTDWNMGRQLSKTNPQRLSIANAATSVNDTAARTVVEISVPWSSFASSMPANGEEWRLNIVHVHHLGTSPLSAWTPLETSNFIDQGGTKSIKANIVDEGRLGSLYFGATPAGIAEQLSGAQLEYISPTSKRLSFDRVDSSLSELQLEWKGPFGDWQPLAIQSRSYTGGRDTIVFDHPDTAAFGQYQLRLHRYEAGQPTGGKLSHVITDRESIIRAGIQTQLDLYPTPSVQSVTYAPPSQQVLDLIELIPPSNGFRFTGLPEMPELHPDALYTLSADKKSLISTKTSTVYPNPAYPENGSITVSSRDGGTVTYPYYEDGSGNRYFLTAHLWYLQKAYVLGQLELLSKSDPMGAAYLLNELLQAFEQYVPTTDYIWHNSPIDLTSGPPFNYWGGLWGRWSVSDLNSLSPILVAFGHVRKTDALDQLSAIYGYDLEQRLLDELFMPSIDYVLSFPKALGNMNYTQWLGLIDAGKALNEPDYLHNAFEWMQAYAETQFLSDGYWKEVTVSYHKQSIDGLDRAVTAMNGYSDPDDYISPRTGRRFDNLNMAEDYPIIDKALRNNDLLVYPNGNVLPVMDTWANEKSAAPITTEGSFLLPATKVARTVSGSGAGQSQAWLQFVPKYGHNHYDPLNLNYYALGQELLPDLGYTYTKDRYFTLSTIGHNTVVVNSANMAINNNSRNGGNIELFAPLGDVQVVRAEQSAGYNAASEYRREPWHITFPGAANGEGYLLDLFRVEGGTRHEYTLNGDANRDAEFVTDLELEHYGDYLLPAGVTVVEPTGFNESGTAQGHYYGYISINDVEKAVLPENAESFKVTLETSEGGVEKARMNIIGVLDDGGNELYLARSPSIRSTRLSGKPLDTNDEADKYDMPKLVLRRDGTQLQSTFITAMEPYAA
ncbi:MAG: Heparinase II/III-like protein, partial [Paenibacillus sp.]|nr:Heparinase II/III-like protein [Paenibacillus sp.]